MGRLIFLIAIGYCLYLIFRGKAIKGPDKAEPIGEDTRQDPVCGVYVARDDAVIGNLEGEKFYFCSMECLEKYRKELTLKS